MVKMRRVTRSKENKETEIIIINTLSFVDNVTWLVISV
uniref:Uncharacterized protein n=1 Tax=Rhizophora mucronata TaxID=61149 RepID=A0A2P2N6W0_RHIMU